MRVSIALGFLFLYFGNCIWTGDKILGNWFLNSWLKLFHIFDILFTNSDLLPQSEIFRFHEFHILPIRIQPNQETKYLTSWKIIWNSITSSDFGVVRSDQVKKQVYIKFEYNIFKKIKCIYVQNAYFSLHFHLCLKRKWAFFVCFLLGANQTTMKPVRVRHIWNMDCSSVIVCRMIPPTEKVN